LRPLVFFAFLLIVSTCAAKDKFEAADFVQQQLNSIGTSDARAAAKTCVAQGTVIFQIVNNGPLTWEGPATLVSSGDELATQMKFPPTVFRTEWFITDGKKSSVAPVAPGRWSAFGTFIRTHDEVLTEGLWGGTLSTAWALSHLEERRAKLEDRGIKKVDGVELHRVDYKPKKSTDLDIQLYFEPETNRHVMTVYLMAVATQLGYGSNGSPTEREHHYRLEERFSDFKSVDNLNLPTHWIIRFTYGGPSEGTIDQYDVTETKITHSIPVDPRNFEVK